MMPKTFDELKAQKNEAQKKRSIAGLSVSVIVLLLYFLKIFDFTPTINTVFFAFGLLLLVGCIGGLARSLQSGYKVIEKFCNHTPDPGATMERLKQAWNEGYNFGEGRINTAFIICEMGVKIKIIDLNGAVLAFHGISGGGNVAHGGGARYHNLIVFRNDGKNGQSASLKPAFIDEVLKYIMQNCPDVAVGENKETLKRLRNKDWQGLRDYAHAQRNT